jgi:5'-3' exoribonuclease 1
MGIPSYFSYIVKNHPNIIKKYIKDSLLVNNLYLDCNSIIYDVFYKMDFEQHTGAISTSIINQVISKIEEYISIIQPSSTAIIAFDGVAPVAKLDQQKSRRYKSWYQNQISQNIFKKETNDPWNTAAITPGTKFMSELNQTITKYFNTNICNKLNVANIIVSGSNHIGEGEHKLFQYIRSHPEKHSVETTVIYGLDADLIMLSINHLPICPNIYLFRETPHFIQSIDSSLEPNSNYYLDIPEFTNALTLYMNNGEPLTTEQQKNKVYDYIFLCFFLGNDFLPHFPAINIRTGGVDKMLNAYKATIGHTEYNLTDGKTIYWGHVRKVVQELANLEEEYFIKEHRTRNNKEKQLVPCSTPEEKFRKFELTPVYNRETEHYINPLKPHWQTRYYKGLFGIKYNQDKELKQNASINYLEGLEWTMKYYTTGCPNWRWYYKYHYPPLLQDLIRHIPVFNNEFVPYQPPNPVSEIVQLCYVLPRASLNLLPNNLCFDLLKKYGHFYRGNYNFIWAYCKYFWESHIDTDIDTVDINEIEEFVNKFYLTNK